MRLSVILELLLIFLIIAFSAYGRVIERRNNKITGNNTNNNSGSTSISLKQATESVNKYCTCNENICNCCREFHIPLVQLAGPGCASLQYLQDDKLAMQLSIGNNILSSNIINGKNPKPVCVTLPGGFSKFCGKIYSIKREADKNFKACLGLELRSASELEASLRVSCFRFGPDGLKLRPAEPLPAVLTEPPAPADDDYDDLFGLDDDDDDDEDDEDDDEKDDYEKLDSANNVASSSIASQPNEDEDPEVEDEEDDLLGFSALFDIFSGDDDDKKTKTTTQTPITFAIPIITLSTVATPVLNEYYTSENPVTMDNSVKLEETVTTSLESSNNSSSKLDTIIDTGMISDGDTEKPESNNVISKLKNNTKIDTKPLSSIKISNTPGAVNSPVTTNKNDLVSNGNKIGKPNGTDKNHAVQANEPNQVGNNIKSTTHDIDEDGNVSDDYNDNSHDSLDDDDDDDDEDDSDIDSNEGDEETINDETQDDDDEHQDTDGDVNTEISESIEDEEAILDVLSDGKEDIKIRKNIE